IMESDLNVCGSADEVFYRGIMDALGYSANREPMRELATTLPLSQLLTLPLKADISERAMLLESVLLGAGGLLPSQRADIGDMDWLSSEYAEELEGTWRACASFLGLAPEAAPVSGWTADRVRPANSPPRRLAAAARLLARLLWEPGGALGPFIDMKGPPAELAKKWTRLLCVRGEGYWATHVDFGHELGDKSNEGAALVGNSRAADMVINVLLPLLVAYAEIEGKPELGSKAMSVYACYPSLSENRITRAVADEALGPRKKEGLKGARRQQGLLHLYKLYCQPRRCYECPLSGLTGSGDVC
ncbi:MAG: DUF2851 family protein, partial [Chloroflexota bacterium]|nr:DUF2851 family protein [Chloroflexota bacterium]